MKAINFFIIGMLCLNLNAQQEEQQHNNIDRPDNHAPISVMGDHIHHKNEWMFSYRFMTMRMKDIRFENEDVSQNFVFENYMVSPQKMTMNMHMLGVMYAPSDKITLMAMTNYTENDMNLRMQMMGAQTDFSTVSAGFGDLSVSALYQLFTKNEKSVHAEAGVVLPTGSINNKDVTAMSAENKVILPYPMQIGSGSVSAKLALNYLWQQSLFSGGIQGKSLLRFNDNRNDYRLGNQYQLTSWAAVKTFSFLSFSLRGEVKYTDEISGKNIALDPMMVSTANTKNSGGFIANYAVGANVYLSESLNGLRFATELVLPAYQEPNGVQLKEHSQLIFGVQYAF